MDQPIGIIDSGVGGLTVVKEVMRQLPKEEILYIGDTARCPYGPRPEEEVKTFTWQLAQACLERNVKMLIIACNTATAFALEEIQERVPIPVIGVIYPGARAALKATRNDRIGVIGTVGTIRSEAYVKALKKINPNVRAHGLACPRFVPLVEEGLLEDAGTRKIVEETLSPLKGLGIDTIVLGCTHYPLLRPVIRDVMGKEIAVICSAEETAREVSALLYFNDMLYTGDRLPHHRFLTTDLRPAFARTASRWLSKEIVVDVLSLESVVYAGH